MCKWSGHERRQGSREPAHGPASARRSQAARGHARRRRGECRGCGRSEAGRPAAALECAVGTGARRALRARDRDGSRAGPVGDRPRVDPRGALPHRQDARADDAHDAVLPVRAADDGGREAGHRERGAAARRGGDPARRVEPGHDAGPGTAGVLVLGPPAADPRGLRLAAATAILALVAALLRLWHIDHGLPDVTEEAFPFRHALTLWSVDPGRTSLDPHWFAYPSLTVYVQFAIQQLWARAHSIRSSADFLLTVATDPSSVIVLGRAASVAADVVRVIAVGRVARRHGRAPALLAMALVAFAPALITSSRLIYADDILAMFCVLSLWAMLEALDRPGSARLALAGALTGLAAGSKYPGALMLVPLVTVAIRAPGDGRAIVRVALASSAALLAFIATTPYVFASWSEFIRDVALMRETTTSGTLGDLQGTNLGFYASVLGQALGFGGVGLLAWSLVATI